MDADSLLYYKEARNGRILEEGINEAGSMCSFIAAGTSYANHSVPIIPFLYFLLNVRVSAHWQLDLGGRGHAHTGFLLGGTAGRTTLAGEGLQHQDGHSHILAYPLPNVRACDPAYVYEWAAIIRDGLRRMYAENEDLFYYITLMNENYPQPPTPKNAEPGIRKGLYLFRSAPAEAQGPRVQLLGSGAILNEVLKAQAILAERYAVAADVWSATSYKQLYHEASDAERWNLLHREEPAKTPWIARCFGSTQGLIVAASEGTPAICGEMDAPDVRGLEDRRLWTQRRTRCAAKIF